LNRIPNQPITNFQNGKYYICQHSFDYGYIIQDGAKRKIPDYITYLSLPLGSPIIVKNCTDFDTIPNGADMKPGKLPQNSCAPFRSDGGYIGRCPISWKVYYIQNCKKTEMSDDELRELGALGKFNVPCDVLASIPDA
jgi:hypothetical protein